MELKKITDNDLAGKGVIGMADVPGLSAREMQQKVEEIVRDVVIPVFNENVDKTVTIEELGRAMFNAGAGDMSTYIYDKDNDGSVNKADNGFHWYSHTKNGTVHMLTGTGDNIKFIPTADWTPGDSLVVNGLSAFPYSQLAENIAGEEIFKKNTIVSCFLSKHEAGDNYNVFFNLGGAGLNFKIVCDTTQPVSPKENTLWINTDTDMGEYQFAMTQPDTRADGADLQTGDVWLATGTESDISFNVLKKNGINIKVIAAYQWNGTEWEEKTVKGYMDSQWIDTDFYIFSASRGINKGTWSMSGGKVTVDASSIYVEPNQYAYGMAVCNEGVDVTNYNTVIFNITGAARGDSKGVNNYVGLVSGIDTTMNIFSASRKMELPAPGEVIIDISALTGIHYPKIQSHRYDDDLSYIRVNEIKYCY